MPQTIFITGASTGLGRATALLFKERGWNVIATMRRPENGADLAKSGITVLPLDVTQPDQIAAAARRALELGGIDVLFNNAGYGLAGPLEGTTDDNLRHEIDTNLLGVIRTTHAFLPHLREKRRGVIITTTSIGGIVTFPFNSTYHATKWALEGWSESMAFELGQFGIAVKTVAPGGIKTDFLSRSLVLAEHPAYAADVAKVFAAFTRPERAATSSTAEQIAQVVFEAATDGKNQVRYVAGLDAQALHARRLEIGAEAFRQEIHAMFLG